MHSSPALLRAAAAFCFVEARGDASTPAGSGGGAYVAGQSASTGTVGPTTVTVSAGIGAANGGAVAGSAGPLADRMGGGGVAQTAQCPIYTRWKRLSLSQPTAAMRTTNIT